jgi:hypothetical protein
VGVVRWAEATKQRDRSDGGRRSCFVVAECSGWWFPALVGGGRSCIRCGGKSFGGRVEKFWAVGGRRSIVWRGRERDNELGEGEIWKMGGKFGK